MAAGDSNPQKGGILSDVSFQRAYCSSILHLGCLGYGFAFCRKRTVFDATTQAVELHKKPFNGIRPRAFLIGNQIRDNDLCLLYTSRCV